MIIIFCCLGLSAQAQQAMNWKPLKTDLYVVHPKSQWMLFSQIIGSKPRPTTYVNATTPLPDSYYQQCYGFFCKREWELQQKVHVPVKLRLGTYQTAQAQEGYSR
ncbi:hypothetical protein GA0116948_102157 [Chitinophaga costaii]|uniref:Uncharacterized protein n=1 Tax=Chitinophaga costaii TaxID=1335309 RepID=A0A1C4AJA7_9BACT|nr:hypothetical protein [Chitinophaga costaii]PUZ26627.1 hypothetical protein DCM91_09465 [Chitinophaga costaii]SCB94688.1 hypothetical protein GA0116948_102157 [Chitinophaga costaii]